jgi:hypothetical protein
LNSYKINFLKTLGTFKFLLSISELNVSKIVLKITFRWRWFKAGNFRKNFIHKKAPSFGQVEHFSN